MLIALLGASAHQTSQAQQPPEQPPLLVEIGDVRLEHIAEQIWVPGSVVSRTDSDIASEVAGRVIWMAEVGDEVEAGDVLVKLDDQRLQIELSQDRADIRKWQTRVEMLDRKLSRFTSMAASQNVSKDELDEAEADLHVAHQELEQARLNLALTEYQIAQSEVRAPFASLVVARLQSPGEYTAVGQNLMRIVDPTQVEATVRAPLSVIPYIERGMEVVVRNRHHQASLPVRALVPVGNAESRMMELRVTLAPDDFAIGSAVRVALPNSAYHKGMTVPRDALVLRRAGAFIYQIDTENQASQVAVKTGIGVGDRIEVFGNVTQSAPVVVRGAEVLRPGQKVRFLKGAEEELAALN
ncbi:efflux RND transporter periplasmic adaptor subunit [Alteromonas aestuariivivens]|uniref:Efflux RND transporter periplasmic adaptor subunit n=2 Tax=Alteromonas aestuariivivens TaxID=1938339 RepID=A0A3D8ME43_9ALTE|nr:efflux RND transporter periplasmic adaptor subunit [Alteromonas aestuariivivens]